MVIVAVAILVASARLVAWTVTTVGTGRNCGAVNSPAAEIVPTVVLPPGMPAMLQVTAVLEVLETEAENVAVVPSSTDIFAGTMFTEMDDGGGAGAGVEPATPPHPPSAEDAVRQRRTMRRLRGARADGHECEATRCGNARGLPAADEICQRGRRCEVEAWTASVLRDKSCRAGGLAAARRKMWRRVGAMRMKDFPGWDCSQFPYGTGVR